jgi:16S rRNA (cytosine967-C5)-methyltransferase
MRLHRPLVSATVKALQEIFNPENPRQADRVIEEMLKSNKQWGSRDRNFIAETAYEIVRNWRLALYITDLSENNLTETNYFQIIGAWLIIKNETEELLPKWEEFEKLDSAKILSHFQAAQQIRKIRESVPDWLDALGESELGADKWAEEIKALNQQAPVVLRANTLKTNQKALQDLLSEINIETSVLAELPDALILQKRSNISKTDLYKNGFFEVQDAASQLVAPFLDVKLGMRVIDACAGAGGKSLHLSALMQNKGRVIAMDVEERKLAELLKRVKRNGVDNIETKLIDAKTLLSLEASADRLLLDVPCSGLGVIRRNPDAKWKLTPAFIDNLRRIQWKILSEYSSMLKKGGKMVFATCSLLPSESEAQIQRLLIEQPDSWELLSERRTSPSMDGYDGFYMACLLKK